MLAASKDGSLVIMGVHERGLFAMMTERRQERQRS